MSGITADERLELIRLRRFKKFWDSLVEEESLDVVGQSGDPVPLDILYDDALAAMDGREKW